MKMNRRNVLVGLGGIVASGGALLGTGAFSTVSADRSVTVNTADDTGALVGFDDSTSSYASLSDGTLELTLDMVNLEATTTVNGVFSIDNNHNAQITLDNSPWTATDSNIDITLTPNNTTLAADGSTLVDLEIDTSGATDTDSFSASVTIEAST